MTPSFFERHNARSLQDLLRIIAQKDDCWRTTCDDDCEILWTFQRSENVLAAATLSVKCSSSQQFFYVAVANRIQSSITILTAKQQIVLLIEELAFLPNTSTHFILQFHGNETSPAFVGIEDFSDEQLRNISCSHGPFEWVNCVFSPQQAVAAFVSSSPRKRNVRFVSGGITDGGEAMIDYLKTHTPPRALGKMAISANVFRGNAHAFLQAIYVTSVREYGFPFLWDELEWVQSELTLALRGLIAKANVRCLALSTETLPHFLNELRRGIMHARAIRWCVYPRDDDSEHYLFDSLLLRVLNGHYWNLFDFYVDADRSPPLFWSHERIRYMLDRLHQRLDLRLCVLRLNGLSPFDFDIDEWIRFLQFIEERPSLIRVELQACSCDPFAAAEWVQKLRESMKRIRFRPRPFKLIFLEADDDPMAALYWQLQVVQGKYDDIRSIESSAARALALVHALSLFTGVNASDPTRIRRAWNPDGIYFLLLSNQDLWIPST